MGSLVIKRVKYEGDLYRYESPELNRGLNIIIGDNGSGKSTFTYFIEYCLGGYLKYFNKDNETEKYIEIFNDTNNYIELEIVVDSKKYSLKRFVNGNVIYVNSGDKYLSFPIYRQQNEASEGEVFSDWLLDRLSIVKQELNLGTRSWKLNINDLLRLVIYDQETVSKKIYKDPTNSNYITDSLIIRKTIFEVLLGISSDEYFRKYEEFKEISVLRDKALLKLDVFDEKYSGVNLDRKRIEEELDDLNAELEGLYNQRDIFLSSNKEINEKTDLISSLQEKILNQELILSETNIHLTANQIEYNKILDYFQNQTNEISEIEKIIFTNQKLNLFSFKICPFCLSEHNPKDNHCLCGEEIVDKDYEKFIYTSKEYEGILKHKKKSLETIQIALDSYSEEISNDINKKDKLYNQIQEDTEKLKVLIQSTDVNKNKAAIDHLHNEILKVLKLVESKEYLNKVSNEREEIKREFDIENEKFKNVKEEFNSIQRKFENENRTIIKDFNEIYEGLMTRSSAKISKAEINEDYMPIVDSGTYKNKSASVPLRLMYFYTILSLALKYNSVKHPKLLIIDTPEASGIDANNLKKDLSLIKYAIDKAKASISDSQIILTTGLNKYPKEFSNYIVERFNTNENRFILEPKTPKPI